MPHGKICYLEIPGPSAVVRVFDGDKELGISGGIKRPAVPAIPEGHSVSSFLRSVLGKVGDV